MAGKPKTVIVIGVLAVVIAAIASISLYNYLKGQETRVKSAVATSKVAVASVEIPVGAAINTTQVKLVDWPQGNLPMGSFSTADQVVGRVALDRYAAGEPIIETKLVPKAGQPGVLSYKIPEGHRAMTVAVDQVAGVAGFIAPGNKVDVVLTTTLPQSNQQPVSKIVLQNVPVLATGQIIEQQKDGKPVIVPTVTMDVTPEDAEKLAIASTQGKLQLVLRRAGDTEVAKTGGSTVTKVIGGMEKPAVVYRTRTVTKTVEKKTEMTAEKKSEAAPKPEEAVKVEVLRGTQKSVETFKKEKE